MPHKNTDTRCYLLELPVELRLNIYDLYLPSSVNVEYRKSYDGWNYSLSLGRNAVALSQSCTQIREEVSAHIFNSVRFVFGTVTKDLIDDLKANNLQAIHASFPNNYIKNVEINVSKYICDLLFGNPSVSLATFLEAIMPMFQRGKKLSSLKFKMCFGDFSYDPKLLKPFLSAWQWLEIPHRVAIETYNCLPLPTKQPAEFARTLEGRVSQ